MERCDEGVCRTERDGATGVCPRCGGKGRPVKTITVRYLIRGRFQDQVQDPLSYRFCPLPNCPVVYFAEDGDSVFTKEELAKRVTMKEREDPVPVCYCFNFFRKDLEEEIKRGGQSSIPEFISAQVKKGNCFCEYTNPQGTCCLGNVSATVKKILREEGKT